MADVLNGFEQFMQAGDSLLGRNSNKPFAKVNDVPHDDDDEKQTINDDPNLDNEFDDEDIDVNKLRKLKEQEDQEDNSGENQDEEDETDKDEENDDNTDSDNGSDNDDDNSTSGNNDDSSEEDEEDVDWAKQESEIASFVSERLSNELGWEFGEDEKFSSINDVVDYLSKVAEESSVPQYANDELQELDEFVRNGGNIREYYSSFYDNRLNLDNVNLESESDQREVVKEYFKSIGYKDTKIDKALQRFEETGILEDQAEDALEFLKVDEEKNKKKLLEEQKKFAEDQQKQQQKFLSDVESNIKDIDNIFGDPLNEHKKRDLVKYLLEPDKNGLTQYQKDATKDIKNWIESAYIIKNKDSFLANINKKAKSESAKELKKRLEQSRSKKSKGKGSGSSSQTSFTDFLNTSSARYLRQPGR